MTSGSPSRGAVAERTPGLARRLVVAGGQPRYLAVSGLATVLLYLAMIPAFHGMSHHGASLGTFEMNTSASASGRIVNEWGAPGRSAARTQLLIDLPFMVSYAVFLAGICLFTADRARRAGRARLARVAQAMAWCGPIAAACDLGQNVALALILAGHHTQPWPMISARSSVVTRGLAACAIVFAIAGTLLTVMRARRDVA